MRALAIAVLLSGGCSFALVHGPAAHRPPDEPPVCTDVPAPPVVDTIVAVLAGAGAYAFHRDLQSSSDQDPLPLADDHLFGRAVRNLLAVGAVIELGSAIYGFVKTSHCVAAKRAYVQHVTSSP
jgi:hypothetical protein